MAKMAPKMAFCDESTAKFAATPLFWHQDFFFVNVRPYRFNPHMFNFDMLGPISDFFATVVTFSTNMLAHLPIKKKVMQVNFWEIERWGEK